jgi:hypothetical protein
MQLSTMDTYERSIIHEFMHVDMFGFIKPHSKSTTPRITYTITYTLM